jgi:hypothetical protein
MPEGVGYGPQNTASVGLNLNYIGRHVYAYSGEVIAKGNGTFDEYLNFQTGKEYIKARLMVQYAEASADSLEWQVRFNGIIIAASTSAHQTASSYFTDFVDLIIPPFTKVVWQITNNSGTAQRDVSCTMTGKIYK